LSSNAELTFEVSQEQINIISKSTGLVKDDKIIPGQYIISLKQGLVQRRHKRNER
jgi:hypothetical protein